MIPAAFSENLRRRLEGPLPGLDAQFRMAPMGRPRPGVEIRIPDNAKQSAVMILLHPTAEGIAFPLILRPTYPGVHSRQVSLPGGQVEAGDRDFAHTALRETEEEVGVSSHEIEVLGQLSELYIPPSNFLVKPWVGILHSPPAYQPDPQEVDQLLVTPLNWLFDPGYRSTAPVNASYGIREAPCFLLHGQVVWGATAMILSEFAAVLEGIEP